MFVELYTPKAAWLSLAAEDRSRYVAAVRGAIEGLEAAGITCLSLGRADRGVDHAVPHDYLGVWSVPDDERMRTFLDNIRASGWYDYFDHVNVVGRDDGVAGHLAELESL